ncbi:unnamed protein product, partial [Rotaria sordida]
MVPIGRYYFRSELHTLHTNCKRVLNYAAEHNEIFNRNLPTIGPLVICGLARTDDEQLSDIFTRIAASHARFDIEEDYHILRQADYFCMFTVVSDEEDCNPEGWI